MNEWELVERLKQKDEVAFKFIVDTWQKLIYNTVLAITQNEEDAEDVSQEVFIKVYESIVAFKSESKLSTWIYKIAITKSYDHLRRKKRKKRFAFVQSLFGKNDELVYDAPDFFHPGVAAENKEDASILFKTISTLPANQNIAFILNKVEGLSYQQISEVMGMSESAVDSLLFRAKAALRKKLENSYRRSK